MRRLFLLAALVAVLSLTASAATVVLTFEGLGDTEPVLNYYNGGLGGDGSGPGPSDGITFGSDSLAIISDQNGGTGNFAGQPSGVTALFFLSGPGDIMDVPAGFTTGFSFFYSAVSAPGTVTVYDGLDATGNVLATLSLPATGDGSGTGTCGLDQFCPFFPIGVSFSGTAMSVDFSGTANEIAFDDITLGSATAGGGSATPEPGAFALVGLGMASLGAISLKRRRLSSK
jgi:hypothetical protein